MEHIKIKPKSVNTCWQGRRFKTEDYKNYEVEMFYLLPESITINKKNTLKLRFGFSSKASDLDNPVKPFVDILQKRYGFNDKTIYRLEVEKIDVLKGEEFIEFQLEEYTKSPSSKDKRD